MSNPDRTSPAPGRNGWRVALVGRRLTDTENLGLEYLAAALSEAGVAYQVFVLNRAAELAEVAAQISSGGFGLVGLSLPDGGSAYLPLAFGELLHRRGFAGPITCGGSFATLARHWLLERYPWLHSVARFAGEAPLVDLVRALRSGRDVRTVAGLTTRAGDGIPAPVLDQTPLRLRPVREELFEVLGHPAAHILATRGCAGRCGYCAPAALQMQEVKEGLQARAGAEMLRAAGVGCVRRRPVDQLCDEMAYLWRDRGVRYFYFVDEHMLPYGEAEALAFIEQMRRGLRRRRVGRFGIGCMLRADRLTKDIVNAFAELGLVRAFVGIELASEDEGRRFGRPLDPRKAREIVAACAEAGIATVSHVMLIHPYSTQQTIAQAIDLLAAIPAGAFEVTQMRVYHGTALWQRMANEGRLVGNPLRYGYRFQDPIVERFDQIFMRLRSQSFWNHSIAYRTHDAFLAFELGRRLRPELRLDAITAEMNDIRDQVVASYVDAYRKALALAEAGVGATDCDLLIAESRAKSQRLQARLDACVKDLAQRLGTSPQIFSPGRAAAAGAIALAFLGGPLSACAGRSTLGFRPDGAPPAAEVADASPDSVEVEDASADLARDARDAATVEAAPEARCTKEMIDAQEQQHRQAANAASSCCSGHVGFLKDQPPTVYCGASAPASVYILQSCSWGEDGSTFLALTAEWQRRISDAIAGLDRSCLEGSGFGNRLYLHGESELQADQIWQAQFQCLGRDDWSWDARITIDDSGRVVAITGVSDEIAGCMFAALEGLVFPCLAGAVLCEEVYIE